MCFGWLCAALPPPHLPLIMQFSSAHLINCSSLTAHNILPFLRQGNKPLSEARTILHFISAGEMKKILVFFVVQKQIVSHQRDRLWEVVRNRCVFDTEWFSLIKKVEKRWIHAGRWDTYWSDLAGIVFGFPEWQKRDETWNKRREQGICKKKSVAWDWPAGSSPPRGSFVLTSRKKSIISIFD